MPFTSVQVSGTYERLPYGTPAAGSVAFQYSSVMLDSVGDVIATTTPIVLQLDATGSFTVNLPATDDVGVSPSGVYVSVTERIEDAGERRYEIFLPKASPVVDLADVAPVTPGPQQFQYALVAHGHALDDLTDVFAPAPTDTFVLAWVAANSRYELVPQTGGGGGAPTTADYLVGTANPSLSAEIVVGTTPGGELGGTWAAPSVDTTHSGSSHAGAAGAAVTTHEGAADPHPGYVLESTFDAKGDLLVGTADNVYARLAAGANATFLRANSATATGLEWDAIDTADVPEGTSLYYTDERVDDRVAVLIQAGTGISWVYSDPAGTLTPTVTLAPFTTTDLSEGTNLYYTDERAQDAIGTALLDTASIDAVYNDALGQLSWTVLPAGVDHNSLANLTTGDPHSQYLLETLIDAKGDLLVGSADNTAIRLAVGANNRFLRADSTTPSGLSWDVHGDTGDPHIQYVKEAEFLAKGDLLAGTGAGLLAARSVGTNGQVLTADSAQATGLSWTTPGSAYTDEMAQDAVGAMLLDTASVDLVYVDATPSLSATVLPAGVDHNSLANVTVGDPHTQYVLESLLDAKGDLYVASADNTPGRLAVGANDLPLIADSAQTLGVKWAALPIAGGGTGATTAAAARTALGVPSNAEAILDSIVDAKGDLILGTAADTVSRFAVGANDSVLMADSAQTEGVKWVPPGTPTISNPGDSQSAGSSDDFARGSHVHGRESATRYFQFNMWGGFPPDGSTDNVSATLVKVKSSGAAITNSPNAYSIALSYDNTTDQKWLWQFVIPGNYSSGGTLRLKFGSLVTSGNVIFLASQVSSTDGSTDLDAVQWNTVTDSGAVAVPGTTLQTAETTITLTATGMAANRMCTIFVGRDADSASDTAAGAVYLLGAQLEYTGSH